MIKKILIGLVSLFFIMPAMANVLITEDAVRSAVPAHIPVDKQSSVVDALVEALENNGGIDTYDMLHACTIAWNIYSEPGTTQCDNFVNALIAESVVDFYDACDSKVVVTNGSKQCLEDLKDIEVDRRSAYFLAGDLVTNKNMSKEKVICAKQDSNWFKHHNDDYIPCVSVKGNHFYTVRFDDAKESNDQDRRDGVAQAVCEVFNDIKYTPAGSITLTTPHGSTTFKSWPASCATSDVNKCNKINGELSKFGFASSISNDTCTVSFNAILDKSGLKTAFGLDNFAFCRDIQIAAAASLDDLVRSYVQTKSNTTVTSFRCDESDVLYTGGGCVNKFLNGGDDVLKCYVNGQEVDFVFDDLSETRRIISEGGYQGLSCLASDGEFDGSKCQKLSEQGCKQVMAQSKKSCPECEEVKWDEDLGICVLPSAEKAESLQKALKVTGIVVAVVAATAVTVLSGGGASGVWALVAAAGDVLTVTGGTAVIASEVATTYTVYTDQVKSEMNKCVLDKGVQCAKDLLKKYLQKMVSYEKDLTISEARTLDGMFAQLFQQIPADDEFWDWLDDPDVWKCNSRGECIINEKSQGWQTVGKVGNIAMLVGGILKAGSQIGSSMTSTTEVITEVAQIRTARIAANPLKTVKSNLVRDITYGNANSLSIPNRFIQQGVIVNGQTLSFAKNSELAAHLISQGYQVGDTVEIALQGIKQKVITQATTMSFNNIKFNPTALASTAYATGDLLVDGESIPFIMKRPSGDVASVGGTESGNDTSNADKRSYGGILEPEVITAERPRKAIEDAGTSSSGTNTSGSNPTGGTPSFGPGTTNVSGQGATSSSGNNTTKSGTSGQSANAKEPVVEPEPTPVPTVTPIETPRVATSTSTSTTQVPVPVPTVTPIETPRVTTSTSTNTTKTDTKKSGISGWGVAAIGAGVAGLGVGTALLIGGAGKKGETSGAAAVTNANGDLFNNVRNRAIGVIGVVENSNFELVPIETSNGVKEHIVSIANHAVVLVKHNDNLMPFMVDMADGVAKWTPFTNVDMNTGAFTRYTPKADIMRTAKIAAKLTEILPPLQIQYFASPNAEGLQFASPSMNGYQLINDNALRYLASVFNKNTHLGVFIIDEINFISGKDYNRPRYV